MVDGALQRDRRGHLIVAARSTTAALLPRAVVHLLGPDRIVAGHGERAEHAVAQRPGGQGTQLVGERGRTRRVAGLQHPAQRDEQPAAALVAIGTPGGRTRRGRRVALCDCWPAAARRATPRGRRRAHCPGPAPRRPGTEHRDLTLDELGGGEGCSALPRAGPRASWTAERTSGCGKANAHGCAAVSATSRPRATASSTACTGPPTSPTLAASRATASASPGRRRRRRAAGVVGARRVAVTDQPAERPRRRKRPALVPRPSEPRRARNSSEQRERAAGSACAVRSRRAARAGRRRDPSRSASSRRSPSSRPERRTTIARGDRHDPAQALRQLGAGVVARRQHDQHLVGHQPAHREHERAYRRAVRPVQIVDDEDDGPAALELTSSSSRQVPADRLRRRRCARSRPSSAAPAGPADRAGSPAPDSRAGSRLPRRPPQNRERRLASGVGQELPEERRLADPGRALHRDDPRAALPASPSGARRAASSLRRPTKGSMATSGVVGSPTRAPPRARRRQVSGGGRVLAHRHAVADDNPSISGARDRARCDR